MFLLVLSSNKNMHIKFWRRDKKNIFQIWETKKCKFLYLSSGLKRRHLIIWGTKNIIKSFNCKFWCIFLVYLPAIENWCYVRVWIRFVLLFEKAYDQNVKEQIHNCVINQMLKTRIRCSDCFPCKMLGMWNEMKIRWDWKHDD